MHDDLAMEAPVMDHHEVRLWVALLGRGIAGAIFGMILLSGAVLTEELAVGVLLYFLVDGALAVYAAKRARVSRGAPELLAFTGVVDVVAGVLAVIVPSAAALRLVAAIRAVVTGLSDAHWARHHGTSDPLTLSGVAAVALGIILLLAWPGPGLFALPWLVGLQVSTSAALLTAGALSELRRVEVAVPHPA